MRQLRNAHVRIEPATTVEIMRRRRREPKVDLTSRKVSKNRQFTGEYLEGTESGVEEIESTATTGFGEAWDGSGGAEADDSLDSAINIEPEKAGKKKHRSLEQTRTNMFIALGIAVVGVAALAFFGTRALTSSDDIADVAEFNTDSNVLTSPLSIREYSTLESPVEVATFEEVDQFFTEEADDGDLTPVDSGLRDGDGSVLAGPVFWAGRAHMAFVSEGPLLPTGGCVVASLASANLETIDLASAGDCDGDFDELGDRTACVDSDVILLEVWPFNPDSVFEPERIAAVRARIEWPRLPLTVSRRTTIEFDDSAEGTEEDVETADGTGQASRTSLLAAATALEGSPGDVVTISMGELSADCQLLDRDAVEVRLLPG